MTLRPHQIDQFIDTGFLRLEGAFPQSLARTCRDLLWQVLERDHGLKHDEPDGWNRPVVRLPGQNSSAFTEVANSQRLCGAFDQLVGEGRWRPRVGLGTFPIRFPSLIDPGDAGWHVDASYWLDGEMRLNLASRGRALLMLFLFSDVAERDAPTRIRVGSHRLVPPVLQGAGDVGVSFADVVPRLRGLEQCALASATGLAGDVYLCHPFLVHAATWPHVGVAPRFLAQPELPPVGALQFDRSDGAYSPVEVAVRASGLRR